MMTYYDDMLRWHAMMTRYTAMMAWHDLMTCYDDMTWRHDTMACFDNDTLWWYDMLTWHVDRLGGRSRGRPSIKLSSFWPNGKKWLWLRSWDLIENDGLKHCLSVDGTTHALAANLPAHMAFFPGTSVGSPIREPTIDSRADVFWT